MRVSIDLRRETNKVMEAIDKNQKATFTRRGKTIAVITPAKQQ
jgi:antitoxin (DNA-binding transcriptional repressor) of toxin-antitoxin stability system